MQMQMQMQYMQQSTGESHEGGQMPPDPYGQMYATPQGMHPSMMQQYGVRQQQSDSYFADPQSSRAAEDSHRNHALQELSEALDRAEVDMLMGGKKKKTHRSPNDDLAFSFGTNAGRGTSERDRCDFDSRGPTNFALQAASEALGGRAHTEQPPMSMQNRAAHVASSSYTLPSDDIFTGSEAPRRRSLAPVFGSAADVPLRLPGQRGDANFSAEHFAPAAVTVPATMPYEEHSSASAWTYGQEAVVPHSGSAQLEEPATHQLPISRNVSSGLPVPPVAPQEVGPANPLVQDLLDMNNVRYSPTGPQDDDDDDELELLARREMDDDEAIDFSARPTRHPSEKSSRPPTFGRQCPADPVAPSAPSASARAPPVPNMPRMPSVTSMSSMASGAMPAQPSSWSAGSAQAVTKGRRTSSASKKRPPEISQEQRLEKRNFIVGCILNDEVPSRSATPRGPARSASRGPSRGPPLNGARVRGASCNASIEMVQAPRHTAGDMVFGGKASPPSVPSPRHHKGVGRINLLDTPARAEEKPVSLPQLGAAKTERHQRPHHSLVASGSQSARNWRGKATLSVYA
mmetsp:Transcript_12389/g.43672  ORF Transcript_12389/g.43672 Transcript_12389/m.43672 type:complete len:573 (+) Transcript_12389:1-1719(+)